MEHGAYAWAPCSYIYATALLIYLYRWSPLPREELYDTYLNGVYKADTNDCIYWPAVSLLFVIFALGALFDPARPPFRSNHKNITSCRVCLLSTL
ncbi:hypothetical protein PILCRDRAFT_602633 [Piloderma croceum F 1598]|uniref:Uncharacterized protein n=1 Tax=Piloderma croceum (strain F 1598) TaxID=765440 RepID=A0A0C3AVQ1_PILCF|nr:hypothetical protein PILCRDRAFT_602633 [Piloderma croceum F 1598]